MSRAWPGLQDCSILTVLPQNSLRVIAGSMMWLSQYRLWPLTNVPNVHLKEREHVSTGSDLI